MASESESEQELHTRLDRLNQEIRIMELRAVKSAEAIAGLTHAVDQAERLISVEVGQAVEAGIVRVFSGPVTYVGTVRPFLDAIVLAVENGLKSVMKERT